MMQLEISFDSSHSCASIEAEGSVSSRDIVELANALMQHPKWASGSNVLIDFRRSDFSEISATDVQWISDSIVRLVEEIGDGRVALVVSKDLDFGTARMWELSSSDRVRFEFREFRARDKADEWFSAEGSSTGC